ncbi:MAG: ATP-binding protein [Deltaproteobacteria bacterium]|nr:ATP-binding protein [Candidatus Zymogenaceae bacterium]
MPGKSADKKPSFSDTFSVVGGNFDDAGRVSSRIKGILKKMCLPFEVIRKAAICTFEAEMNIVCYAQRGDITLSVDEDRIVIEVVDQGEGIPDIDLAMQAGYSTSTAKIREMGFGAGMGLMNIDRYADDFDITSEVGKGTKLVMIVNITEGS